MVIFILTTSFTNENKVGEAAAISSPRVFKTFRGAINYINNFASTETWKAELHRQITPKEIIKKSLMSYESTTPICTFTYKGTRKGKEIFFAIYTQKID